MADYGATTRPNDLCTREGAQLCADRIVDFWRAEGSRAIRAWVSEAVTHDRSRRRVYCVETNLVGGLPPDWHEGQGKI